MKIRFWDRVMLFLCALALVLAGAYLIAQSTMMLSMGEPPTFTVSNIWMWAQAAAGVLLAILGAYLFAFPGKFFRSKRDFVIQQTEIGELRIAVTAIENLVQKCIDVHPEIHVVSMHVRNGREGVVIDLRIALANNISIPLAVASLQKQIKQYLSASSGIDVKEIQVSVETAEDAAAEGSPYLVPSNAQAAHNAAEKAAESREKEKPALHRRIFGHSEQPAIVPEAPAAPEPAPAEMPAQEAAAESAAEAEEKNAAEPAQEAEEKSASEPAEPSPDTDADVKEEGVKNA